MSGSGKYAWSGRLSSFFLQWIAVDGEFEGLISGFDSQVVGECVGRCASINLAITLLNGTIVIVGRLRSDFRLQTPLDSVKLVQKQREQKEKRGASHF